MECSIIGRPLRHPLSYKWTWSIYFFFLGGGLGGKCMVRSPRLRKSNEKNWIVILANPILLAYNVLWARKKTVFTKIVGTCARNSVISLHLQVRYKFFLACNFLIYLFFHHFRSHYFCSTYLRDGVKKAL